MDRPISIIGLILIALVLLGGTFGLLIAGRPVPEPVWIAWGVVMTALYGHGTFLAQNAAHVRTVNDLLDAVQTGARAATTTTPTAITEAATQAVQAGITAEETSK